MLGMDAVVVFYVDTEYGDLWASVPAQSRSDPNGNGTFRELGLYTWHARTKLAAVDILNLIC